MRVLVSVRNVAEAALAAEAGVDFIDLKEPANGALGALPLAEVRAGVATVRRLAPAARVSATVGDWPAEALEAVTAQARAVAACGVDDVKVGVPPGADALLVRLGALRQQGLPIVPVLLADGGVPRTLPSGFAAVMLDTQDKLGGSLRQRLPLAELAAFVRAVQAGGAWAGLAGALTLDDARALAPLAPDFLGFRSAVCAGPRAGALCRQRLDALLAALAAPAEGQGRASGRA
ncbi:MAG: hypothetical protein LCH73_06565 [Proteobacteria bacterium]|nr:hypothetical protein [Pseudomonadota bacterium]